MSDKKSTIGFYAKIETIGNTIKILRESMIDYLLTTQLSEYARLRIYANTLEELCIMDKDYFLQNVSSLVGYVKENFDEICFECSPIKNFKKEIISMHLYAEFRAMLVITKYTKTDELSIKELTDIYISYLQKYSLYAIKLGLKEWIEKNKERPAVSELIKIIDIHHQRGERFGQDVKFVKSLIEKKIY